MESKQAFGGYIREKRQELGLSQRDLAERLFISESAVSKWERGVSYPDITLVSPLCEALGVSEHELVTASDDERQRRIEREAGAHRRARAVWLVAWSAIYVAAVLGAASQAVSSGVIPGDVPLAAASCALLASFTHVPVIARRERGALTLAASFVSSALVMLVGLSRSGEGWASDFGVGMAALLFCYCLAFLPVSLPWLGMRLGLRVSGRRALLCLAVDSALLLILVAAVCLRDEQPVEQAVRMAGVAAVMLAVVWAVFLSIRYIPAALPFRLAAAFASLGVWVFLAGGLSSFLLGGSFDLHAAADFSDWTSYPAVNDNLCWIALIVCLAAAAALCAIGARRPEGRASDR